MRAVSLDRGGYLWMACNGMGVLRDPRPTDRAGGERVQCDPKNGKTTKRYSPPWPGGMHGVTWNEKTQKLWVTAPDPLPGTGPAVSAKSLRTRTARMIKALQSLAIRVEGGPLPAGSPA